MKRALPVWAPVWAPVWEPAWAPVWLLVCVLLGGLAGLAVHAAHFGHLADDAYISMRYADQWLRGEGVVFNPGERVLGYSNPSWVAALALLGRAGFPLPAAAQALGLTAAAVCVWLVWGAARAPESRQRGREAPPLVAVLSTLAGVGWLAANGPFALWARGGLEGPLFALLLAAAIRTAWRLSAEWRAPPSEARSRAPLALAAILVLLTWTRPEGIAYAGLVCCWCALDARTGGREPLGPSRRLARSVGLPFASALAAWLAFALFSQIYYGDWLPNTYYAKWQPLDANVLARGYIYTRHYVEIHYGAPLLVVALWLATAGRSLRARGWLPCALLAAFVLYYVRIGGDALVYYRMWAYVQPCLALLLVDAVATLASVPARRVGAPLAAAAALALPLALLPNSLRGFELQYLRADDQRIRSLAAVGKQLRRDAPTVRIAANVIGALGFESRAYLVDMLGLTDRHIARAPKQLGSTPGHEAHDGGYVLTRAPDLIFVGIPRATQRPLSEADAWRPSFPSDADLRADPRFARDYRFGHWQLDDGRQVALYARRDYSELPVADRSLSSSPTR